MFGSLEYVSSKNFFSIFYVVLVQHLFKHYQTIIIFIHFLNRYLLCSVRLLYGRFSRLWFVFPENKLMLIFLPIPIKAKYFIPGIIILDLFSAVTGQAIFSPSNTAFVAHLGGALTGYLIMRNWKNNQFDRNRWQ